MKLKRYAAAALAVLLTAFCGRGGVKYDFREIEKLELIETLGIDVRDRAITVSAATGARQSAPPTVLTNSAYTVGLALREMQTMSDKDIYFAHVGSCVVGEQTAREGLGMYLDFIERELSVRFATGLFVVRGGSAQDVITKVGDENGCVTELLEAMKKDVEMLSDGHVFTVGEVARAMLEDGCALVSAVRLSEEEGIILGGSKVTVVPDGYALIIGDRLACFIGTEAAHGVNILMNRGGEDTVEVEDGAGGVCALSLTSAKVGYKAKYGRGGIPETLNIDVKLTANLEELHSMVDVYDSECLRVIENNLREVEEKRVREALGIANLLKTDYLGIGRELEMKNPLKFGRIKAAWPEIFSEMEIRLNWDVELLRTYDIGQPLGSAGNQYEREG